jgi:hypothetical protein
LYLKPPLSGRLLSFSRFDERGFSAMTILPIDDNNNIIPALRLRSGGAQAVAATTAASATNATAFDAGTRVVSLYASGNVYVAFGGADVAATTGDHYFPTGVYYDFAIGGGRVGQYSHVAVLAADSNCTLYVSEKE